MSPTNPPTSTPPRAVTPVDRPSPDSSPSQSCPIPDFALPSYSSPHQNPISAMLLANQDKLPTRPLKTSKTKPNLWLASIAWAVRHTIRFFLPWSCLSDRVTLYMLFVFASISYFIANLLRFTVRTVVLMTLFDLFFEPAWPLPWKEYLLFEAIVFVILRFHRLIHDQLPSCVAGATKVPYKYKDVLRTLRLLDEHEIERRAFPDHVVFTVNKNIEKGVSGPYDVRSVNAEVIVTGLQRRAKSIPLGQTVIFALSYAHEDRDLDTASLSIDAARGLCNALRGADLPYREIYLWSDITLSKNAYARESWDTDGLMPYIAYPTVRIGCPDTYWTNVELDIAHARNAQEKDDDILTFTRHLVGRRRDRGHDEDDQVNNLLYRMRAFALGMRRERGMSGLQRAINASLLVGPAFRETTVRKELTGGWDGASEFVDEAKGLRDDEHAYLKSAIALCTCMFVLEKNRTRFAVWIYKDEFDDCVVVVAKMELGDNGSYCINKKVRLIPPAWEQWQLLELHNSPNSEISYHCMKELLERADIFVNLENVGTRRVHPRSLMSE